MAVLRMRTSKKTPKQKHENIIQKKTPPNTPEYQLHNTVCPPLDLHLNFDLVWRLD